MNSIEIKQALRKLDFPECAKEALKKLDALISGKTLNITDRDFAMDLISEFIFYERDRRGNKRQQELSYIQEIQLLKIFCDCFQQITNENTANNLFSFLFGTLTINSRIKILFKLVSIAISQMCTQVLIAAGNWMQHLGGTSTINIQLANALIKDYFSANSNIFTSIFDLPKVAPIFTSNFLTALAEVYLVDNTFTPPPENILKIITNWIQSYPSICLLTQQQSQPPPANNSTLMPPITPLVGLFKWCILSPLYSLNQKQIKMYTRLHLALLECIVDEPNAKNAIYAQHLLNVIVAIQDKFNEWSKKNKLLEKNDCVQVSLERLAQVVQVSIAYNYIYGNIQDLLNKLESLPSNRLLTIVISSNKVISL